MSAAIRIIVIAVVAQLDLGSHEAVATGSDTTVLQTAVAVGKITVIALLSGTHHTIAAARGNDEPSISHLRVVESKPTAGGSCREDAKA
jgi:hypothetical protein